MVLVLPGILDPKSNISSAPVHSLSFFPAISPILNLSAAMQWREKVILDSSDLQVKGNHVPSP